MTFKKNTTVSVSLVKILALYAQGLKIDFKAIMASMGLDPAIFNDDSQRVSSTTFDAMWQKIAGMSDDPHPGLNFGQQIADRYPGGSLLFTMMLNCASIGKALDTFIRYHRIMADAIQPKMDKTANVVRLSWEIPLPGFTSYPYLSEALLSVYHSILSTLSRGRLRPEKVCFTHTRPDDIREYEKVFNVPVHFGEKNNELIIQLRDLDIEIHLASAELYALLEKHADTIIRALAGKNRWSNKTMEQLTHRVLSGKVTKIDPVAQQMALSRRTLQEKLKAEKTNFRTLLETVRRQIAVDHLRRPGTHIVDLAFLLGYSDQSAFNHAFKRWTGKSPKAFARKN